jgi:L-lactate dehydrogenase complex protein LldF
VSGQGHGDGGFPAAAEVALADTQLRANLRRATTTIRARRAAVVSEVEDWEALRTEGARIKDAALADLDRQLGLLEAAVERRGGVVHWARDGGEANEIVVRLTREAGADAVVKVKSLATDEIGLNGALEGAGIEPCETDLAELIVQLGEDRQSHIVVPAIHRNRAEIRRLFESRLGVRASSDEPAELAAIARAHLREKFLTAGVGISGANFAVAETGTVCVVESEGNGRMCTTLPQTLITVMGIEKVVPELRDLGTMLRLLARSATGERLSPYTSLWTGARPDDGPRSFHLVLLDNGRSSMMADPRGRETLRCIRCAACLNVCPVYERTGGHAYESVYPGPIGAILTPQLSQGRSGTTLPWASSLCGACYEVCPVKIDIPSTLIHLRGKVVRGGGTPQAERLAMRALARLFSSRPAYEAAQRGGRAAAWPFARGRGKIDRLPRPLQAWTSTRDLPVPGESFRDWWRRRDA